MKAKGKSKGCTLQGLVDGYNHIMKDPKIAKKAYGGQLDRIGRAANRGQNSTFDQTVEKWPLDHIPG